MKLTLPYPPSDNRYYKIARNRRYLSKEGVMFRESVNDYWLEWLLINHMANKNFPTMFTGPVSLDIYVITPDRRKRDILNLCKAIGDSLQYAGILEDDNLIHTAMIRRGGIDPMKKGFIEVSIDSLDGIC